MSFHRLRNATRPLRLVFRDTALSSLRRRHRELQSRFSILSVKADLNRSTLQDTAKAAQRRVENGNKLIAVLAKRLVVAATSMALGSWCMLLIIIRVCSFVCMCIGFRGAVSS